MATQHNFRIKNGLEVGGTERITAAGAGSLTDLTLSGNLTVNGTTVTLDATTLQVADKNIVLNYHASSDTSGTADGAGITIQDAVNSSTDATFNWSASNDRFVASHGLEVTSGVVSIGTNSPQASTALDVRGNVRVGDGSTHEQDIHFVNNNTEWQVGTNNNGNGTDSNQFYFYEGGNYRLTVQKGGKVGIGTASPTHQLHLKGPSSAYAAMRIESTSTGHGAIINLSDSTDDDYGQIVQFASSAGEGGRMRFIAGGTETLNLRGGKVGIGTDSPSTKLEIREDTASGSYGGYPALTIRNDNAAGYGAVHFNEGTNQRARVEVGNGSGTPYLGLYTTGSASGITIKDGKVGIGNTTPENSHANANMLVVGSGSAGGMALYNGANAGGYYFARDNANNTDAYDGGMSYDGSRNLKFHTNAGAARMTIGGTGNVGVGDTNPQHPFKVNLSNGQVAMFGSNGQNSTGQFCGIGLGQVLANNTSYQKVKLVYEGRNNGNYIGNFHILVDTAGDSGDAVLADKKLTVDGGWGTITMPKQPSFMCYPGAHINASSGVTKQEWSGEAHDSNNWYNNATYRFTAPVDGQYLFVAELALNVSTTGLTYMGIGIKINGSGSVYYGGWGAKTSSANQYEKVTSTIIKQLSANDYVELYVELSAGVTILGGANGIYSRWCGQLLS